MYYYSFLKLETVDPLEAFACTSFQAAVIVFFHTFCNHNGHNNIADHFIATLKSTISDWQRSKYLGFTVEFDDAGQTVSLSMPEYVPNMLARFYADTILRGAALPTVYIPPHYGNGVQHVTVDNSASRDPSTTRDAWLFIVLCSTVDNTMMTAANHVSSDKARPT